MYARGSEFGFTILLTVRFWRCGITFGNGGRRKADLGWVRANLGFITDKHQVCVGFPWCKFGMIIDGECVSYGSLAHTCIHPRTHPHTPSHMHVYICMHFYHEPFTFTDTFCVLFAWVWSLFYTCIFALHNQNTP